MKRWSVRKVNGQWRVYDRGAWWDTFDTLEEAHTYATQNAVADELYESGGLTRLSRMLAFEAGYNLVSRYSYRKVFA